MWVEVSMESLKKKILNPIVRLVCSPLDLSLIPSRSNVPFPLSFRRNQDFYFTSVVTSECNFSFVLHYHWSIENCSSSIFNETSRLVDSSLLTSSSDFFVRSQTLPLGFYQIQLTVTRNNVSNRTKSAFVRITPSGITANLVLFGTSMINVAVEQDLQLDPGNHSIGGDGKQFNASVRFSWIRIRIRCFALLGLDL